MNWINLAQDEENWLGVVNIHEPLCCTKCRKFLNWLWY